MDAVFNDTRRDAAGERAQRGRRCRASPTTLVVETLGRCDREGVHPLPMPAAAEPPAGAGRDAGRYQQAAADAAWSGDARDAVQALSSHPLVRSIDLAERLYAEMAEAHRAQLPERLAPA